VLAILASRPHIALGGRFAVERTLSLHSILTSRREGFYWLTSSLHHRVRSEAGPAVEVKTAGPWSTIKAMGLAGVVRRGDGPVGSLAAALRRALPRGRTLPDNAWAARHRAMLWMLWAHVAGLPVFALTQGLSVGASLGAVLPIALAGVAAMLSRASRRARSVAVVFGLLTASAVLVGAWHGQIEAHFHFFVVIAVLALYEDWLPFGLAIAYVVGEHGVLGAVAPHAVYDHGGNPWAWAAIHGLFVLGAVSASVVSWRLNEDMRDRMGEAYARAQETAERFRLAFESGVSGMALVGSDGRFLKVNQALCDMVGYAPEELLARDFQSLSYPEDLVADHAQMRAMLEGATDVYETEKRYRHRDGSDVWVHLGVSAVRDEAGAVRYFISRTQDITVRRRFQDELAHRALHDPLTGLPNRALLVDRLQHAIVRLRRQPGQLAVLFVDLDRFKLVNDGMGHGAGDAVLVEAASRLAQAARAEDTVSRFGGDEFTILCVDASPQQACQLAERVLQAFEAPFAHEGREFHLSASIGVRIGGSGAETADKLLRDADLALYSAKERGRSRMEVFDPTVRLSGVGRLELEQALRLAVRAGDLRLHYQPEVDLSSGRIVAVEALVRWQHAERGLLAPGEFIPVAEESGLIVAIGEWVLEEACRQLASWRADGTADAGLRMAVNVSARQLCSPGLPETIAAALARAGLEPGALLVEITESALIQDAELSDTNLQALRDMGVAIALDDFGTGFSSLGQIRDLPAVDVIKVDRSFTAGLGRNDADGAVVTAVLVLARSLGVEAVAEGIETPAQLELLRGLGCDIGQGFHFARPLAADAIASVIRAGAPLERAAG
jgi:diguanylate cyclase (GGDEF)-like protein/PAS domain S-box-containing protein